MTTAAPTRPSSTISASGAVLLVAAAVGLLVVADVTATVPVTATLVVDARGFPQSAIGVAAEIAAALLLTFGRPSVTAPGAGRSALVVWAGTDLLVFVLGWSVVSGLWVGWSLLALRLAGLVAAVLATVAIVRAGILRGVARWALLAVAGIDAALQGALMQPSLDLLQVVVVLQPFLVRELALVALGLALLLHGRGPAIRHRLRTIREQW